MKPLDLTDKRFGHIVAKEPTDKRELRAIIWKCVCDCGSIVYRSHTSLKRGGENANCGCIQSEIDKQSMLKVHREILLHTDNTFIRVLETNKVRKDNTSGVKGVHKVEKLNKWRASIGFQGKRKHIGDFEEKEDAIKARLKAEKELWQPFLDNYYENTKKEV